MSALVLLFLPSVALAESSWLTARGRLAPETRLQAFVGTNGVGLGLSRPDDAKARTGFGVELVVGHRDRDVEFRGARVWQLTEPRFATASLSVGGAVFIVPDRLALDAGVGPNSQLSLSLGGERFTVDLSLQTAVEIFARGGLRLPQRAGLGLSLRLGDFVFAVMSRLGVDLVPDRSFVGRGEVMASVGWLGLDHALGR